MLKFPKQICTLHTYEVIEWIPYDRFKDIREIAKGEFRTIYKANWIDGPINMKIKNNDSLETPEVLSGEEYTKAGDVYSFGIIAYEIVTSFAPYYGIPHNKDLARQICNGLQPKIPFHILKLITKIIMRVWDARVSHRHTFEEFHYELAKYDMNYEET
ncbi:hypothetical protein Glove_79g96 [Diversispora epigaea]|uniref:Protein kinase domain-containing protein n=1 Tax=Diversispora epigaea TaxID=1348612 RepID=A0A397JJ60_9GLOM|nr:hypothetical protein Glove_79g96 [Diversispora epigaea]